MATYTIGEVAERTGFTTSALRYYEKVGVVVPTARTDAGYRTYDDECIDRLAFVARAKQLGCSLDEITDLVALWENDDCGPVQRRLHALVTEKISDAQRQIGELSAFTAQLRTTAAQLDTAPVDGACGPGCACSAAPVESQMASTSLSLISKAEATIDTSIACTLDVGAIPGQLEAWQRVLSHAAERSTTADGRLRLVFDNAVDLGEVTSVVAAEQGCCSFFAFAVTVDQRGIALEVDAPAEAADIVRTLFGTAS